MSGFEAIRAALSEMVEESTRRGERSAQREGVRELWTYDTETDGFHNCEDPACLKCGGLGRVPKPFLHGVYNGEREEYEEFESVEALVEFVQNRRALFYAHNGGKFDYHPLRAHMNTDEPLMLINGRISKFRIGRAEFRDSLNIFPNTRLADFGVKNEIDYAKMEPGVRDDPNIRAEISSYMRQDCRGLWEQVDRYRRDYGKGLTQAGTSMKYWEKHHHAAKAPRQTKAQFEQCRPYYYGGRVQCFEAGVATTQFKVADINSAYPRAMLERHPLSPLPVRSTRLPRGDVSLQTALIKLRCTARGCFPWRDPQTGELFFPEDEGGHRNRLRQYHITGWELLAALERDAVSNIHIEEVLSFDHTVSFKEYIEHHYQARMEAAARGDLAGKIFGKYFMNSLYGKFGADPSNYAEYVIATSDTYEAWKERGYVESHGWGPGRYLMERKPTEAQLADIQSKWRYYNVATAASITGYVRAFLFKAISTCGGAIYCDTDSIAARDLGPLEYGERLGQWKDEGTFDRYAIAGKKLYAFHQEGRSEEYDPKEKSPSWKIASKGVAFHASPAAPRTIADLACGQTVLHRPDVPTFSVTRQQPVFINRSIRSTAKDIRRAPEPYGETDTDLVLERIAPHIYLA